MSLVPYKDGQRVGRGDEDGFLDHPHPHYQHQPIDEKHRHERSRKCSKIRDEISEEIATFLDLSCKTNWTVHELHNSKTCLCNRGKKGKVQRGVVNEKRRAYYKTEANVKRRILKSADNVKYIEESSSLPINN